MAKLTLSDVSNILGNPTTAATTINANNDLIEAALENTLSRNGTTPNSMAADLDMNNNDILNVDNIDVNTLTFNGVPVTADDLATVPDTVALNSTTVHHIADRVTLKELDTSTYKVVFLKEDEREGLFRWELGDYSAHVAQDTQEAVFVKSTATSASVGSWVRDYENRLIPEWFGASESLADNKIYLQAAIDLAAYLEVPLEVFGKTYLTTGGLFIRNKLVLRGFNSGSFKAKVGGFSGSTGAFFTNVSTVQAERAVSDFEIDGMTFDLSLLDFSGNTTNSENCLGLARGASRGKITNNIFIGASANFEILAGGYGGKGLGLDGGVRDIFIRGNRFENCYIGYWQRGSEIAFTNGLDGLEQVSRITLVDNHWEECMVAIALNGRDPNENPDNEAADFETVIIGGTYHNCGFCPNYPASSANRYKTGVIMLEEAQNVLISGLRGYNDATYIADNGGWPATGTVIGQGLSGAIGAIVYGWGSNCRITVSHNGDVDYYSVVGRAFGIGGDAAPSKEVYCTKFDLDLTHIGSAIAIFRQDDYDPVSASSQITGNWRVSIDTLTGDIVGTNATSLSLLTIEAYSASEAKSVRGSPAWLGSTFGTTLSASSAKAAIQTFRTDGLTVGGGSQMTKILFADLVHDFGTVAAHTVASTTVTVTGVTTGVKRFVDVALTGTYPSGLTFDAQVTAADTVTIFCTNGSTANIASGSRTYSVMVTIV